VLGVLTYSVAHVLADHFLSSENKTEPKTSAVSCPSTHVQHTAVIENDRITPARTTAKLCDTLTIVNRDKAVREVAFGLHEHHTPYDGIAEKTLRQNQSFSVTLNQTGTFRFHDHFHDEVAGYFTVEK